MANDNNHLTTFEEAKLCPKCGRMGKEAGSTRKRNSRNQIVTVHFIECVTELCPWFGTKYFVQVNEDGSIPQPYQQLGPKKYPRLSPESASRVEEAVRRETEVSTQPDRHGEVRNPHS